MILDDKEIQRRLNLDLHECADKFRSDMALLQKPDLMETLPFIKNIPVLDLRGWNVDVVRKKNNCMNFALNHQGIDLVQPGQLGGYKRSGLGLKSVFESLAHDPIRPIDSIFECEQNEFPAALFHEGIMGDCHWFGFRKQMPSSFTSLSYVWAHKMGNGYAETASENDAFTAALELGYREFLGYFAVPHDLSV